MSLLSLIERLQDYHGCDYCQHRSKCKSGYACKEYKDWAIQDNALLRPFALPLSPRPTARNYEIVFESGDDNEQ